MDCCVLTKMAVVVVFMLGSTKQTTIFILISRLRQGGSCCTWVTLWGVRTSRQSTTRGWPSTPWGTSPLARCSTPGLECWPGASSLPSVEADEPLLYAADQSLPGWHRKEEFIESLPFQAIGCRCSSSRWGLSTRSGPVRRGTGSLTWTSTRGRLTRKWLLSVICGAENEI